MDKIYLFSQHVVPNSLEYIRPDGGDPYINGSILIMKQIETCHNPPHGESEYQYQLFKTLRHFHVFFFLNIIKVFSSFFLRSDTRLAFNFSSNH